MRRLAAIVCVLGVLVAAPVPAVAAGSGVPSSASMRAAPGAVTTGPVGRGVTLITGDSVRVRTLAGRTIVQGLPVARTGVSAAFQTIVTPQRTYVIPASARPYIGRLLDPALFDVTLSAAAGGRIPVRVSFSGATAPAVPGVTITSTRAGASSGYLTPSSARRFGAALAAAYRADAKAHFPARTTIFGASRVTADVPASPVANPLYPMRTLLIKVLDSTGAPVPAGFVTVYNTDNFAKFINFAIVTDGQARLSVPIGTYGLDTAVDKFDATGNFVGLGIVTRSDYKVVGQNQLLTIDGRTATSRLSVRTPRSAVQQTEEFDIARQDAAGTGSFGSGYAVLGSGTIFVAKATPPVSGTLAATASWTLTGAPLDGSPFAYSLHFPATNGIAANQAYSLITGQLATFKSRLYVDAVARSGGVLIFPMLPGSGFGGGWSFPVQLPSNLITYVNAIPGAVWSTSVFGSPDPFNNPFAGTIDDGPRLAPAGTVYSADWGRGPALPNVPVETNGYAAAFGFDCPSCRTATALQIALNPATDSTPGHTFEVFGDPSGSPVARLRVYRNGALVSDATDTGFASFAVPASSGTYRVLDEVDRRPSLAQQSLQTTTDLTFVSASGQGGALPPTWTCSLGARCTVLPLLDATVLLPTDLTGAVPVGTSTINLTVGHIQGAPSSAITSARMEIRRPGGAWTALPTGTSGGGSYRATLRTTVADEHSAFDLRITATDAAKGRIVQTATSAFDVAGS